MDFYLRRNKRNEMKRQFLERSRFQLSAAIGEGEDNDNR
jgi:hypothetical protein